MPELDDTRRRCVDDEVNVSPPCRHAQLNELMRDIEILPHYFFVQGARKMRQTPLRKLHAVAISIIFTLLCQRRIIKLDLICAPISSYDAIYLIVWAAEN